jgi:transcriptional regulator with XRE-family HTH domain
MSTPAAHETAGTARFDARQAIAAARKACGITQEELARQAAISLSLLRKIEQGSRPVTPGVRTALSAILGAVAEVGDSTSVPERIGNVLPRLREAMDVYDIPAHPASDPRSLRELRIMTGTATTWRLASQYSLLAGLLPGLITDLTFKALTRTGHEEERAFALLTLAYRAADAIADKHGCHDMSARATELVRWAAARSGDPQLEMMSCYVRAELFFGGGHATVGLQMLDAATGPMPPSSQVTLLATHGALCMRAAVLAAHAGLKEEATERMAEARAAARHVPEGVYHGTAFGPGSVHVHDLALAVESGDIGRAVKVAAEWQPLPALPAERRSHFHIEAARAYCWAGHRDRAVAALWQARRAAPQHTRYNPAAGETVRTLIRGSRKPSRPLLQLADWIGCT